MALADWLNPATPQPTYLTSRAAGVVVPEFYKAASEVRKNALGLASDEQSLRVNEEQSQRAREADIRRRAEEAAAAAVMPRLSQLDPTSQNYFGELSKIMTEPGGANALANQSVRSFLDIAGGARSESLRREEDARLEQRRIAEESRDTQRQVEAEDRQAARSNVDAAERLLQKYAEDAEDDDFQSTYTPELNKVRELQKADPTQAVPKLAELTERMTRERNQRVIKNKLLRGLPPEEVEKIRVKDGGKFGDYAKYQLGRLETAVSKSEILRSRIRGIDRQLDDAAVPREAKQKLAELRDQLLEEESAAELGFSDRLNPALSDYFPSSTPKASGGSNDVSKKIQ